MSSYPSGVWRGYWEQPLWGRQPMEDLNLRFEAGTVEGAGTDVIGPFLIHGGYDDQGCIWFTKAYPTHLVIYQGTYDGEGTIFGEWSIGEHHRGPFALSAVGHNAEDAPIQQLIPEPPRGED